MTIIYCHRKAAVVNNFIKKKLFYMYRATHITIMSVIAIISSLRLYNIETSDDVDTP